MSSKQTVLLAVFDILGFSSRVRNSSLSEVRRTYDLLLDRTARRNELDSFDLMPAGDTKVPALLRLDVESVVFSDSVFAWVPLRRGFANPFLKWCCHFICEGLGMDVPIRGAIAAGEAILDRESSTYLGKPILEAHELEAAQNWIGLAFSHQATWPPLIADIAPELLMEFPIPLKTGNVLPLTLDWPRVWRSVHGDCPSGKLRSLAQCQPEAVRKYYIHAAELAEHALKHANWFNEEPAEGSVLRMRPSSEVRDETLARERRRDA
jgi:hypothetical protein